MIWVPDPENGSYDDLSGFGVEFDGSHKEFNWLLGRMDIHAGTLLIKCQTVRSLEGGFLDGGCPYPAVETRLMRP